MKKILPLLFAVLFVNAAFSQEEYKESTVSIDIGQSLVGSFLKALDKDLEITKTELYSIPAIQASYQFNTSKHFSIGLAVSFQQFGAKVTDFNYAADGELPMYTNYDLSVNRINVGLKPTFYYVNKPTFALYSGARLGLTNWGLSLDGVVPGFTAEELYDKKTGMAPAMQLVLVGFQATYTEGFGVHMEFAVGSPYYIAGGVHYKF